MTNGNESARLLGENGEFLELPKLTREWILSSPNATSEFATFFEKGGAIQTSDDVRFAAYADREPPLIVVNAKTWESLRMPGASEWGQRALFGQMAHEIGHDRFNTGSVPFTGKTAEEYVQYRAGLEAEAIFNTFPIFKDLEKHPDFKEQFPFNDIGYLSGMELGQFYKEWNAGQLTDKQVVERISAKVPDVSYTLGGGVQDQNADGKLTHRDNYLQDFKQYIEPTLQAQALLDTPTGPTDPAHPDNGMLLTIRDGVQKIDTSLGKDFDEASERVSRCTLVACKETGLHHVDHVVLGKNGENLFAVQGGLTDPAQLRAHVPVEHAIRTPVEQSDERLLAVNQSIARQQDLTQQPDLTRSPDDPTRGGPVMR